MQYLETPTFDGHPDPQAFADWVLKMDHLFEWYKLFGDRKVQFAKLKLVGQARLFWQSTEQHYARRHQPSIVDWIEMKEVLHKIYIHHSYQGDRLEGMETYFHCMDQMWKIRGEKKSVW